MATIGLDKLFYAEITEDSDGSETYGVPASLAKAISADLSVELAEYKDAITEAMLKGTKRNVESEHRAGVADTSKNAVTAE